MPVEEMEERYYGVNPEGDKDGTGQVIPPVNCDAFEPPKSNGKPGGRCALVAFFVFVVLPTAVVNIIARMV